MREYKDAPVLRRTTASYGLLSPAFDGGYRKGIPSGLGTIARIHTRLHHHYREPSQPSLDERAVAGLDYALTLPDSPDLGLPVFRPLPNPPCFFSSVGNRVSICLSVILAIVLMT